MSFPNPVNYGALSGNNFWWMTLSLLLSILLSPWGGIKIGHDEIVKLPTYFSQDCIPVTHGMPPYDYFAIPPARGRIPIHRTDVGTLISADLIGVRSCIFIKDEKGLYSDDPKKNPKARFIPKIGAKELMQKNQDDLVIERPCLEILQNRQMINKLQIINGLEKGNITRALNGRHVGTLICKE
jgi:molybdenum storage protein